MDESKMEALHDSTKSKDDLMNFSDSASGMIAAMSSAEIEAPEAQEVRNQWLCQRTTIRQ